MTDLSADIPDTPDLIAAELALGLLEGEERAAALRRVLAEPGFAGLVEAWRDRFAQLFDLWPEVEPPADIAERIDASLGVGRRPAARRSRFPWPALAIGSSALAAALLGVVATRGPAPPPAVRPAPAVRPSVQLIAVLGADGVRVAAVVDPASATIRIAAPPAMRPGRAAQLWVIGADGVPHALALLDPRPATHPLPGGLRERMVPGATLAISVEPAGGSPTGLPTGPVVATGVLVAV